VFDDSRDKDYRESNKDIKDSECLSEVAID
jgi:hypothetical protein